MRKSPRADQPKERWFVKQAVRMGSVASGPVISFIVLFALPLTGAFFLNDEQYAFWAILSSITTVALSLDFGGVAWAMARHGSASNRRILLTGGAMSSSGAILIGLAASLLWIPFSNTAAGSAIGLLQGIFAIALTTAAAVLRSLLVVLCQIMLHENLVRLRNVTFAAQAFSCYAIAVIILALWETAWALPIAWALSTLSVLGYGLLVGAQKGLFVGQRNPYKGHETSTSTFVWSRSVASILSAALMQADKWVVGAIAGPAGLAAYDVAWRVATLPRFLLQNLSASSSADASAVLRSGGGSIYTLLKRATLLTLIAGLGSSILVGAAYKFIPAIIGVESANLPFIALLVAFTAVGCSAPLSFISIAIGKPALDIPYLTLAVLTSAGLAAAAFHRNSVEVYVFGNAFVLLVTILWFLQYGSRSLKNFEAGRARPSDQALEAKTES
jgi:O-antigen/teichoic acid export membrane protein